MALLLPSPLPPPPCFFSRPITTWKLPQIYLTLPHTSHLSASGMIGSLHELVLGPSQALKETNSW